MNILLKSISYLFHPLLMPLLGAFIYFTVAPRFIPEPILFAKILGLVILTILIPIIMFFFLKNLGIVKSIHLKTTKQRKIPLLLQTILLLITIKMVLDPYNYPELYFFFLGAVFSTLSALFMVIFNIKASLHMIGISGVTMFAIALSIHFGINLTLLIGVIIIISGLVATSRLHVKAHNNTELILGFLTGVIPQIILIDFWL